MNPDSCAARRAGLVEILLSIFEFLINRTLFSRKSGFCKRTKNKKRIYFLLNKKDLLCDF